MVSFAALTDSSSFADLQVRIIIKGGVWRNTGQPSLPSKWTVLTLAEDEILKAAISKYGKNVREASGVSLRMTNLSADTIAMGSDIEFVGAENAKAM